MLLATLGALPAHADAGNRPARTGEVALPTQPLVRDATVLPDRLLVTLDDTPGRASWAASLTTRALGARETVPLAQRVQLVTTAPGTSAAVADALLARGDVVAVEPDVQRAFHAVPNDTSYDLQWAHAATNIEQAWDHSTGGGREGETRPLIAVVDSGVDATHPELAGTVVASLRSASGVIVQGQPRNDECGIAHGTAVAGVVGAAGNNGRGITGALWNPRIIEISLTSPLNDCPRGPADSDAITAMAYLSQLDEPPLAMNLSFGTSANECTAAYQAAIDQARAAGIVVVSSAGNAQSNANSIPASCNGAISVGATGPDGTRATYSQFNPYVDLSAPGGQARNCPNSLSELASEAVLTTSLVDPKQYDLGTGCTPSLADPHGDRLEATQGTSFSTPYVAAAAALLRQHATDTGRTLSVDEVEALLEGTATDAGPTGRDDDYGWGALDVGAAMAHLVSGQPLPALQPDPDFAVGPTAPVAVRVSDPGDLDTTDPISQAVAISRGNPAGTRPFAVLARVDDFADALSGAALGLGIASLLYTSHDGALDPRTREELLRVLDFETSQPVVYVMGGTAAIPAAVDDELRSLGITVQRIAGGGREETAVQAAAVVEQLKSLAGDIPTRNWVFVTSGRDFADAVTAGQMAAYYGIPILVTNAEALHPTTAQELTRLAPDRVVVVGGETAVSSAAMAQIEELGFPTSRAGGATRIDTALAVFDLYAAELAVDRDGAIERAATVAVNLRDGFTDALSASLIAGQGNWYLPLEGMAGNPITPATRGTFCDFGGQLYVIGGRDRIDDDTTEELLRILAGEGCSPG